MSNICSNCQNMLDTDAGFCASCGTPTIRLVYCPSCGKAIESNAAFCKYCAYKIDSNVAETENPTENPASLISPSGAAFALICFFLPWTQVSCGDKTILNTGADLGGIYWFVPFLALVAFAAYFICKYKKTLYAARAFVIGSASLALCMMAFIYYTLSSSKETQIKYGYFGSLIGFLLAIAGCFFITRKTPAKEKRIQADAHQFI